MDTSTPESRDWQNAVAALRDAEDRHEPHATVLLLSAAVIRARNALTVDQVRAGTRLPDDVLRHFTRDDQLLRERDDTALSSNPPPSRAHASSVPEQRGQVQDASP